jgi:Uma2 family endonuclease
VFDVCVVSVSGRQEDVVMSVAHAEPPITWEEFLALPDDPRYRHAELVDGVVIEVNPPTWLHQEVVGLVYSSIRFWIGQGTGRGSVTMEPPVRITGTRGYLPDVAWYRDGRHLPVSGNPYLDGAPDLAVEVLSPSTRTMDMIRKRTDYARVGVAELWLIDPAESRVMVLRLNEDGQGPAEYVLVAELGADDVLTTPLMKGLEIPVTGLGEPQQ